MRKTKIICTLGPSSNQTNQIFTLAKNGMNIARLNLSHSTFTSHQQIIDNIKQVNNIHKTDIKIMLDTKGPEIRIGSFVNGEVYLKNNQTFTFTTKETIGNENCVSISYKNLINEISVGKKLFANNGMMVFKVLKIESDNIVCKVLFGGKLTNNKGVNAPNIVPKNIFLSEYDKDSLLFAIKNKVDYVSLSFVSNSKDVVDAREFLNANNGQSIKLISKIENESGVKNINQIVAVSDGIMIARGDLGVEIPLEKIPAIQKRIIKICDYFNKPCIVATEMLESMTYSIRPTRAEVNDVANAIYDQATSVMLSGETAIGKHPQLVVKMMNKIILEVEKCLKK